MNAVSRSLADAARRLKAARGRQHLPGLVLMTDRERLADPLAAVARLPRGSAVILREPDAGRRRMLAATLAAVCRPRRIRLLIAADWRLAATRRADGLHLPEALATGGCRRWQRARRPGWLVTAAAHGPRALRRAAALGVDAALLSPVFATRSHPSAFPLGPLRFARQARMAPLPVIALGGITGRTARRLNGAGAAGFAAIDGLAAHLPAHLDPQAAPSRAPAASAASAAAGSS